ICRRGPAQPLTPTPFAKEKEKTMTRNRFHVFVLTATLLLAGASRSHAAVDPDLLVLEAKVNGVTANITALGVKVGVVDAALQQLFSENEEALLQLGDARRRDLERVLLGCALAPDGKCLPPAYLSSVLDPKCSAAAPLKK